MTAMDVGSGGARRCGRGPRFAQASRGVEVTNSLAKAAERFLRRQVAMEDASPFHAAPAARAEHAARLSAAQVAPREDTTWRRRVISSGIFSLAGID